MSGNKQRLDEFLSDRFGELSKMYLRELVRDQKCEVNGRYENIGYRLRADDFLEIELDVTRANAMRPEQLRLDIVYEDSGIIVVNKAAGMLVHPSHRENTGTLLNALSYYLNARACGPGHPRIRPGLVNRLDKETSGLVAISKTPRAHRILALQFEKRSVKKVYAALVDGIVEADSGIITGAIGRYPDEKRWGLMADGKPSETRYTVVERFADSTRLKLQPVTGRTNQLRIHCASIGHPIVGDTARGGSKFPRLCLHACELSLRNPTGGERLTFTLPIPEEFAGQNNPGPEAPCPAVVRSSSDRQIPKCH